MMHIPSLYQKINAGFFNTVYAVPNTGMVLKVPKKTSLLIAQTHDNIREALKTHQQYFDHYIPETHIEKNKKSPMQYVVRQKYIQGHKLTTQDIQDNIDVAKQRDDIQQRGQYMQKEANLYFDMYGIGDYLPNIFKLIAKKPCTIGNILLDQQNKLHFIDIGYIKLNTCIGRGSDQASQLMLALTKQR